MILPSLFFTFSWKIPKPFRKLLGKMLPRVYTMMDAATFTYNPAKPEDLFLLRNLKICKIQCNQDKWTPYKLPHLSNIRNILIIQKALPDYLMWYLNPFWKSTVHLKQNNLMDWDWKLAWYK